MDVETSKDVLQELLKKLQERSELRGRALFWRLEPVVLDALGSYRLPPTAYLVPAMNPQHTLLLDLSPSWEDLQVVMHQKTRYNIRVAERKGVTVRTSTAPDDLASFLRLMDETAERDGFRSQPLSYIRQTFLYLAEQGAARIRLAEYEGVCLAASMEIVYGDTTTYLYGASSSTSRETMAPYLLHAEAIQEAKKAGYRFYDWWGINPDSPETKGYKATWEGITRFKRGWGGEVISLPGTYDVPVYSWLYKAIFSRRAAK
jgi:lipid II:glycine glycyltransferase (peptidoglycan interpeptide bridge formation enzyme)